MGMAATTAKLSEADEFTALSSIVVMSDVSLSKAPCCFANCRLSYAITDF